MNDRPVYHKNIKGLPLRVLDSAVPLALTDVPSDEDSELDLDAIDPEAASDDDDDDDSDDDDSDDEEGSDRDDEDAYAGVLRARRKRGRAIDAASDAKRGRGRHTSDAGVVRTRRHADEAAALRRERRRALYRRAARWQAYYAEHYQAAPSAYCMYRLAVDLGREQNDSLWMAIVSVTNAYFCGSFGDEDYEVRCRRRLAKSALLVDPAARAKPLPLSRRALLAAALRQPHAAHPLAG